MKLTLWSPCFPCPSAVLDQSQVEAGGFCDVCKIAVRYIDGILEGNATQAQIEDAVRKVCSFVPEAVRGEVRMEDIYLFHMLLSLVDYTDHLLMENSVS